jgi:predicted RNA binding protein YcfA (HicA-like mRNA interferase family)
LPDRRLVPVPYQTLVRIFEKDGFSLARQEGDHKIFTKPGVLRPLVIPTYRAVPVFIIIIRNLLRTSGMSRERYFELMEG